MRLLLIVLVLLTAVTQYPLWWGKGGWQRVRELEARVQTQEETNEALEARNNALAAEVQDLTVGSDAIEERARSEMGLVQEDEIFVHLLPESQGQQSGQTSPSSGGAAASAPSASGSASGGRSPSR